MRRIHAGGGGVRPRSSVPLVFVTIPFRAEVTFGVYGLAAVSADGAAAVGDLHAPATHGAQLGSGAPEAGDRCLLGVGALGLNLARHEHHAVGLLVVAESDLADAEGRVDRLIEAARLAERIIGRTLTGKIMHAGSLAKLRAGDRQAAE